MNMFLVKLNKNLVRCYSFYKKLGLQFYIYLIITLRWDIINQKFNTRVIPPCSLIHDTKLQPFAYSNSSQ